MKTAEELLQAYVDGDAQEAAALFADDGALELPYLARRPRSRAALRRPADHRRLPNLSARADVLYPGLKFVDVKLSIDTPDQAFGEYTIHQRSGISGKEVHQRFFWPPHGVKRQDHSASRGAQSIRGRGRHVSGQRRRGHQQEGGCGDLAAHRSLVAPPRDVARPHHLRRSRTQCPTRTRP
jgi:hypothetical protein